MKEKPESRWRARRPRLPILLALLIAATVLTVCIAVVVEGASRTGINAPRPPYQQEPGNMPDDTSPEPKQEPAEQRVAPATHNGQGFRPGAMPQ